MAERPIFVPTIIGSPLVQIHPVDFEWFPGLATSQARRSIASLHDRVKSQLGIERVLEISTKSHQPLGVKLSSFNLLITTKKYEQRFSVECAYQASKVFERGGPFLDLLKRSSMEAKRDKRLRSHGRLLAFRFFGETWVLKPRTAFYDWLYLSALCSHPDLAQEVLGYQAFSDIAFNPERSINCQAYAAALFVSLNNRGISTSALLRDRAAYLDLVSKAEVPTQSAGATLQQSIDLD